MKVKIGKYPNHRFYHNWLYNWFGYSPKQKTSIRIDNYDTWSMDDTLAPIILPMLVQLKEDKHGAPMVDMKDVPKELRATKKQIDVYSKGGDVDPQHFERWDWILDEMIWAFEQKIKHDDPFDACHDKCANYGDPVCKACLDETQERMSNGFKLFGKYYESLWD
jgi:hypothetical protein